MDFFAVNLFLMLCYVRPHEWIGMVQSIRLTAFSLVFAIMATFMRERGFTVKALLRTPHDLALFLYIGWAMVASHNIVEAWKEVYAYIVYYLVAVQALSSMRRIQQFLTWWAVVILFICGFAIASEYGFDPTGSFDITHGPMKGRLILNTSIFNNPNALGHGIIPVIVMLYFLLIWNRPIFAKIFAVPLMIPPLYCLYLTESKGAFLAAFAGILVALTFNRPKIIQGLMLLVAGTVGWSSMYLLPRMHELDRATSDQAIQGRVAAFRFGLATLHSSIRGIGMGQFATAFERIHHYAKSSHSSYVQIGTETGWIGLTAFLGILYCSYRTLLTCRTRNIEEERVRRILLTFMVTFTVSSWMVDFAWRASFFLMVGTVAAFHRLLLGLDEQEEVKTAQEPEVVPISLGPARFGLPEPLPAGGPGLFAMQRPREPVWRSTTIDVESQPEKPLEQGIQWNKIGWLDVGVVLVWSMAWERLWRYLFHAM